MPPAEPATITRNYFGNTNFFGGPSPNAVSSVVRLREMEVEKGNAMFVLLSGEKKGKTEGDGRII